NRLTPELRVVLRTIRQPAASPSPVPPGPGQPVLIREIMHRFALLPWGDENRVPPAGAGAGRRGPGFAVVGVAVAGAECAQWWRRAACRHCSRLDRSRP